MEFTRQLEVNSELHAKCASLLSKEQASILNRVKAVYLQQ